MSVRDELPPLPDGRELPGPGALPPGSRMPFARDPRFVGRVETLHTLADLLLYGPPRTITLLAPHGAGKTAAAIELIYRYGRFTHGVHWLSAAAAALDGEMAVLDDQIAAAGLAMSLADWPAAQQTQVALTLDSWRRQEMHLLVVDNLDDVETARRWLPRLAGLRVLALSSCLEMPGELGLSVLLPALDAAAEAALISAALAPRRLTESEITALGVRLAHLPLAESLAGRCLAKDPERCVDVYLADVGDRSPLEAVHRASWNTLSGVQARRLLLATVYTLPDEPIPLVLLRRTLESAGDAAGVDSALDELLSLDLLRPGRTAADLIMPPTGARWIQAVGMDDPDQFLLSWLARALAEMARSANEGDSPARFAPLLPHIQAVLSWLEKSEGLQDVTAALWNNLGYYWSAAAEFERAREAFVRALALDEAFYGPDHPNVAADATNLGSALYALGDLDGARQVYERALAVGEAFFGIYHPALAGTVSGLGQVFYSAGHPSRALVLFERAIRINEARYGPRHPEVARNTALLGYVLHDLGDLEGAQEAFERALGDRGDAHPDTAALTSSLGEVLYGMGDLDGAQQAFARALSLEQAARGRDHPNVARDLNNLGIVLHARGDLSAARRVLEQAGQILNAVPGLDSLFAAAVLNNLGGVLHEMGDLEEARTAFEQAVSIDEAAYGPDHPGVAMHAGNLARVLREIGELEEARAAYERALAALERFHGPAHLEVGILNNELGDVLRALGDADGARSAFQRALAILRFLPRRHPQRQFAQRSLHALRHA